MKNEKWVWFAVGVIVGVYVVPAVRNRMAATRA